MKRGYVVMKRAARIPLALRNRVSILKRQGANTRVYLLGTAHLSDRSKRDVEQLIEAIRPSDVFLELCASRTDILYRDGEDPTMKNFGLKDVMKAMQQGGNLFGLGYAYLLHSLGKELELTPGAEFRAAFLCSQRVNANVYLGDRDVRTTVFRVWHGLSFFEKCSILWQVIFQSEELLAHAEEDNEKLLNHIDSMTEGSGLKLLFEAMDREFPWVVESLLRERDVYMALSLKRLFRGVDALHPHRTDTWPGDAAKGDVVAVVGAAHVDGIISEWLTERTQEQETEVLRSICSRERSKIRKDEGDGEHEDDYEGKEGFTKTDLSRYVADFKARRADTKAWEGIQKARDLRMKQGLGVLYEREQR